MAEERTKLLSKVSTHDTKELWSSIGHRASNKSNRSVIDLGPPFHDIGNMNQYFAKVVTDPDYDLQRILSHVKMCSNEREQVFSKLEVSRALQSVGLCIL